MVHTVNLSAPEAGAEGSLSSRPIKQSSRTVRATWKTNEQKKNVFLGYLLESKCNRLGDCIWKFYGINLDSFQKRLQRSCGHQWEEEEGGAL